MNSAWVDLSCLDPTFNSKAHYAAPITLEIVVKVAIDLVQRIERL